MGVFAPRVNTAAAADAAAAVEMGPRLQFSICERWTVFSAAVTRSPAI